MEIYNRLNFDKLPANLRGSDVREAIRQVVSKLCATRNGHRCFVQLSSDYVARMRNASSAAAPSSGCGGPSGTCVSRGRAA